MFSFRKAIAAVLITLAPASTYAAPQASVYGPFSVFSGDDITLYYSGPVNVGDFLEMRKALRNHSIQRLVLNSPGGNLQEGLKIASSVFDRGISTYIPAGASCESACSFIWFAGDDRHADGALGVHQFYAAQSGVQVDLRDSQRATQFITADIVGLLSEFDTPPSVLERMLSTTNMYYFSRDELNEIERGTPPYDKDLIIERAQSVKPVVPPPVTSITSSVPSSGGSPDIISVLELEAAAFVIAFNKVWSDPGITGNDLGLLYDDTVKFYGKTISRQAVMKDKDAFSDRWPIRTYIVNPSTVHATCTPSQCLVDGEVSWAVRSEARGKSGLGFSTTRLLLTRRDGSFVISQEDGKVIKK